MDKKTTRAKDTLTVLDNFYVFFNNRFFLAVYHIVPANLPINNKFPAQSSCTKLVQNILITGIELLAHLNS